VEQALGKKERMKKIKKIFMYLMYILAILFFFLLLMAFIKPAGLSRHIQWGTAFSKKFATGMGLDWQRAYLAILDELKPKTLRLAFYWTEIEPEKDKYFLNDYDWMIREAEKRGVKIIPVIGRKVPRWPECFIPQWAKNNSDLFDYIKTIVNRYKNSPALYLWQVENEPFLKYGECPKADAELLEEEVALVHSLDSEHKVLTTDSGELSTWFQAAARGDVFGTTMYRIIWDKNLGYVYYWFFPVRSFWLKANLIRIFNPAKPILVSELQAEPWGPGLIYDLPLEEQFKSMNLEQFNTNIEFARRVGFPEVYLWGAEWWYWMKEKHNDDSFWKAAQKIIRNE
jgi:hypothetical protein